MIELYINGHLADIDEGFSIEIETVLATVENLKSDSGEYSFSFTLPPTDGNAQAFSHSNILSKKNKYGKRYDTVLIADGHEIFTGSLYLSGVEPDGYHCNFIALQPKTIEEIFGESVMSDVDWKIAYSGYATINSYNAQESGDILFPLVCYGAWQKKPVSTYQDLARYNSLYTIDNKYNRWYEESFVPSMRYVALVSKMLENKGYVLDGSVLEDETVNSVFLSNYIESESKPDYNYGNPTLGSVTVDWDDFTNEDKDFLTQSLKYPYEKVGDRQNLDYVRVYDLFTADSNLVHNNGRLFRENLIAVPADGMYKIDLEFEVSIAEAAESMDVYKWDWSDSERGNREVIQQQTTIQKSWDSFPVEVHLVRNSENVELIHHSEESRPYDMYPHEPEAKNLLSSRVAVSGYSNYVKEGELIAYDVNASDAFICGATSDGSHPAVIKNGGSWNADNEERNYSRYNQTGYWNVTQKRTSGGQGRTSGYTYTLTKSSYNQNVLDGALQTVTMDSDTMTVHLQCVVGLKRNDALTLKFVTREYVTGIETATLGSRTSATQATDWTDDYKFRTTGSLTVTAFAKGTESIVNNADLTWENSPKPFDTQLQLGNFLHSGESQSDFFQNFLDTFNLDYSVVGNKVTVNRRNTEGWTAFLPILKQADEWTSEAIEYPRSMEMKFSVDDGEAGFYASVPQDHINDDDWKDWAASGSEPVVLNTYATEAEEESSDFSYCWYHDFLWEYYTNPDDEQPASTTTVSLPLIAEDRYFIDGGDIEEYMKHDGRSLKQRMWFPKTMNFNIPLSYQNATVHARLVTNELNGVELSYYNKPGTLLTRYFNVAAGRDEKVQVEAYLTVEEYLKIKSGCSVKFNDSLYQVLEIRYDVNTHNARLTLIEG